MLPWVWCNKACLSRTVVSRLAQEWRTYRAPSTKPEARERSQESCVVISFTKLSTGNTRGVVKNVKPSYRVAPTDGGCHLDLEMRGGTRASLLRHLTFLSTNRRRADGVGAEPAVSSELKVEATDKSSWYIRFWLATGKGGCEGESI